MVLKLKDKQDIVSVNAVLHIYFHIIIWKVK